MARITYGGARISVDGAGVTRVSQASFPASGLVARWEADAGLTTSGNRVTAWADQVGGLTVTPNDPAEGPDVTTLPSNTQGLQFNDTDGMKGTTLTGLPTGSSSGTLVCVIKPNSDASFFSGFGYGDNVSDQSRVIGCDDSLNASFDFFNDRITGPNIADTWAVLIGTYDGTTAELFVNGTSVASKTKALSTGTESINIAISFSGVSFETAFGAGFVYDRVLDAGERSQITSYLTEKYITDTTTPTLSSVSITSTTAVTASHQVHVSEAGTAWWALTTTATPLSVADLKAGTGAAAFGNDTVFGPGDKLATATGLTASTTYYAQWYAEDLVGLNSGVVVSSGVATAAPDTTAPVLSGPTDTANGSTGAAGSVSTDEGNGTLYWVASTSSTAPSKAQVKAGQDHTGASAAKSGSKAVTATGVQNITASGLNAATSYTIHFMQEDVSSNQSDVASGDGFTTDSSGEPTADATVSNLSELTSQLSTWASEGPTSPKIVDCNTGSYGSLTVSHTFSNKVTIRSANHPSTGAEFSKLDFSDASNIEARYLEVYGTGVTVQMDGSTDCGLIYCEVHGPTGGAASGHYGIQQQGGALRCYVKHCYIHHKYMGVLSQGCDDFVIEGNVIDRITNDDSHTTSSDGFTFRNNWFKRFTEAPSGHLDASQMAGGVGSTCSNYLFEGNVKMKADASEKVFQGLFSSKINNVNGTYRNNIILTDSPHGVKSSNPSAGGTSGITAVNNTCLFVTNSTNTSVYTCIVSIGQGGVLVDDNMVATSNGTSGGAGPNGVSIEVGSSNPGNYSGYATYFDNTLNRSADFGDMMPKTGSRAHWDHADPTGAHERFREIFVDGDHPGNQPGPVAAAWDALYNGDGGVTS